MNNVKQIKQKTDLIEYSNWELVKDVAGFIKPYKRRFFLATFFRFTSDIFSLYPAYGLALIVTFFSKYKPGESLEYFWIVLSLLSVAYILKYTLRYLGKWFGFQVAERISLDAQAKVFEHLCLLDIAWHEKENAGNKLKRIQKGSAGLDRIVRMWMNNFIEIGINFVGMIFIISKFDKMVSAVVAVFLVTYFAISNPLLKKAIGVSQEVDDMEEKVSGLMFQAINNIRSVKVLAMAEKILKMINIQLEDLFGKIRQRIFYFQTRYFILNLWVVLFEVGIISLVVYGIVKGHYEVGILVLFSGYFNKIVSSVDELSEVTQDLVVCKYGIARMQQTLKEPVVIDVERDKIDFPRDWKKLSVRNLSFSYGGKKTLDNISFEINRGERIGVVGLSGAGKSTLLKLLLKENENYEGEILFDNTPLKKIEKKSYFNEVGVVLQDTEVFNFTLRDNILIASSKDYSEQNLEKALDIANVTDFLKKLPLGIDTYIGEKGVKLSGGEKQRLGIARAVYKQPEILFLDEATSHLDLESEEKIRESLHEFFQEVTAIVVAHRLTTIKEMDKIMVIEGGKIIEFGSFDELYNAKGRLFELWEKQKF